MKFTSILTILSLSASYAAAEIESQIPLGLQAATGYRTDYVHRGITHSGATLDFQLEGEAALSDTEFIGYSTWFATSTGSGDFSETGLKLSYTKEFNSFELNHSIAYRHLSNSIIDSGFELDSSLRYYFQDSSLSSHAVVATVSYDTGANGWYGSLEYENYTKLGKNSYLTFETGLSVTQNYYTSDGANDLFARLSYTYNISKQVSFTPFVGTSIQLDNDQAKDRLFAGAWFEVSF